MEVLIVSKTKYGETQVCVGGVCVETNRFVRLLRTGGKYQPFNTELDIGDIWDISYSKVSNIQEPHNEDVILNSKKYIKHINNIATYIKSLGVPVWKGNIDNIYESKINWTYNGSGYISQRLQSYPRQSVGFWVSDKDLNYINGYYFYDNNGYGKRKINYKGTDTAESVIPKGTLIRFSLAKWWCPDDSNMEERCYLQLSGCYKDNIINPLMNSINKPTFSTSEKTSIKRIADNNTKKSSTFEKALLKNFIEDRKDIRRNKEIEEENKRKRELAERNKSGGCYIASLCYNDEYTEDVCSFRDFRDNTLKKYILGRSFIRFYYKNSPKIVVLIKDLTKLNKLIKIVILSPLLYYIKLFKLDK